MLLASPAAGAGAAQLLRRPAARNRKHRQGLSAAHPEVMQDVMARAGKAPAGGRSREASRRGHRKQRDAVQFAASGGARQPAGQRHDGRVLRLQLRLLQARPARHARSVEDRPQSQIRAQGIPGSRRGLGRGRPCRGRRAHAGHDRQEIHRVPPEAAGRPRAGRQGARARRRQGGRLRHGADREGHGQRRGEDDDRREL